MSRLQNISKKLIPLILLIAVAIGSFCVYFNQHYLTAKNPLTQAVAEHYEEQNNTNRIKKPKYKIIKEIATKQEKINYISKNNYKIQNTLNQNQKTIYFKTSIKDKEIVYDRNYKFTITHLTKLEKKSVFVYVNDKEILQFTGRVLLKNGENSIKILAQYIDENRKVISVFADYTVYCKAKTYEKSSQKSENITEKQNFSILTDLKNKTVYDEKISFYAKLLGASQNGDLTVVLNGKTVKQKNENYSLTLNIGTNFIRLKATDIKNDATVSINQNYTINFVPLANEQTEPKIDYINIQNNQNIKGTDFLLNIIAKDYQGNRIYKNGIQVKLNNTVYQNKWDSSLSVYRLYFSNGKNTIDIKITDKDGRFADYSYTINCQKADNGELIGKIKISIDAKVISLGYIQEETEFQLIQGKNGAQTVADFLQEHGFDYSNKGSLSDGFYLYKISKKGISENAVIPHKLKQEIENSGLELNNKHSADSLGEQDFCYASGWMIKLNGNYINYNLSDAVLKDGDALQIRFTLAYGKDIGGYSLNGSGGNFDIIW